MELLAAAATSFWLGILTAISPCPLATNIAAVSYVGKRVDSPRKAAWTGAAYVFGRVITYVVLGGIVTAGVLSIPGVSNFLQKQMNRILGPLLILLGLVLLGWLPLRLPGITPSEGIQERASRGGLWGACLLGAVFAMSLCPVSAALFFGSLIPLSMQQQSYVLLPSLYGIGTGLPVLVIGFMIAAGGSSLSRVFHRVQQFERWVRVVTAILFLLIGVYMILRYVFYVL